MGIPLFLQEEMWANKYLSPIPSREEATSVIFVTTKATVVLNELKYIWEIYSAIIKLCQQTLVFFFFKRN